MPWKTDRALHHIERVLVSGDKNTPPTAARSRIVGPILNDWKPAHIRTLSEHWRNGTLLAQLRPILEASDPLEAATRASNPVGAVMRETKPEHVMRLSELWTNRSARCPSG